MVLAAFFGTAGAGPRAWSNAAKIESVETAPWPASLNSGLSAASARRARQKLSATTATASSSFTTFLTPGIASAGAVSTATSLPPCTGAIASAAYSMPGMVKSMA